MSKLPSLLTVVAALMIACGGDDNEDGCAESPQEFYPTILELAHADDSEGVYRCLGAPADGSDAPDAEQVENGMVRLRAFPEDAPVVVTQEVADGVYLTGIAAKLVNDLPAGEVVIPSGRFQAQGFLVVEKDGLWVPAPFDELYPDRPEPVDGRANAGQEVLEFGVEESSGILSTPEAGVWVNGQEVEVESLPTRLDPQEDIGHFRFSADLKEDGNWVAIYLEQPEGQRVGVIWALRPLRGSRSE